ncbi:hypothetical protein ABK040_003368 [Willaertia magna]
MYFKNLLETDFKFLKNKNYLLIPSIGIFLGYKEIEKLLFRINNYNNINTNNFLINNLISNDNSIDVIFIPFKFESVTKRWFLLYFNIKKFILKKGNYYTFYLLQSPIDNINSDYLLKFEPIKIRNEDGNIIDKQFPLYYILAIKIMEYIFASLTKHFFSNNNLELSKLKILEDQILLPIVPNFKRGFLLMECLKNILFTDDILINDLPKKFLFPFDDSIVEIKKFEVAFFLLKKNNL